MFALKYILMPLLNIRYNINIYLAWTCFLKKPTIIFNPFNKFLSNDE